MVTTKRTETVAEALNAFQIELPSWGFANTGTRFGKFLQAGAASTIEEKLSDAAQVHRWTGVCPTVALHILWDLPNGVRSVDQVQALATRHGLRAGSINPNVFQDQAYKYGSLGNPDPAVRQQARGRILDRDRIRQHPGRRDPSPPRVHGATH